MTTERTTALATPSLSDKQLRTRIELAQRSFGLQQASQIQLNIVYLLCQRWDLDPLTDITLFEGRPWITIDGRVKLMRRHPEYRGYACRPLSRDEKEAWGYEADDIVIECVVRTTTWGEISARGKVSAAEVRAARVRAEQSGKRSAPIGMHPVEIAEKRAIARAERAAFGQDAVLDEEEAITILEERKDPERNKALAAKYDEIYGSDANGNQFADMPQNGPRRAASESAEAEASQGVQEAERTRSELEASYHALLADAEQKLGEAFNPANWMLRSGMSDEEIEEQGVALGELLRRRAEEAPRLREEGLLRNAALLADAEIAGVRGLRLLKASASEPLEHIVRKNRELGQRLASHLADSTDTDPPQPAF